ncbi:MAG: hypothetical protein JSW13_01710 [Candidatus Aerophobus sp.]|nr:MAG: hypothetical protein JSW13_01710 [Candidatus Aerophobus sp.]
MMKEEIEEKDDIVYLRGVDYKAPEGTEPTKIVAAAVLQDGKVWAGRRHFELIWQIKDDGGEYVSQDQQGFWTDDGRFVRRVAAMGIARESGQVVKGETINPRELFSEDLW